MGRQDISNGCSRKGQLIRLYRVMSRTYPSSQIAMKDALVEGSLHQMTDLESVFVSHYAELVGLARLWVGTVEAAEDVVQDTFAGLEPSRSVGSPLPYLRSAVANRARSAVRRRISERRALHRQLAITLSAPTDSAAPDETIVLAVRALPRRQRDVLILRFYLDWPTERVAHELGITPEAVRASTYRGLGQLRARITTGHDDG